MNFRSQQREDIDVNLTPLIDIVFLLLIFFMITTTFDRNAELKIDLPDAESASETQTQAIEIVVDAQGHYFIEGNELVNTQADTLAQALSDVLQGDVERAVILRADAQTPHQAVVTAMDVVGRLGISRLSIATTQHTP